MRKVFLEDLPRWESDTRYSGSIKWVDCNGLWVNFIYDNITDSFKILKQVDYNYLKIKYKNVLMNVRIDDVKKARLGCIVNVLAITHPHISKLLKDRKLGFKRTFGSNKKEIFVCDMCGAEKERMIATVTLKGYKCDQCFDGVSYPEKFIISVLKQCKVSFLKEYNPKWSFGKRYDFFIPSLNCIIEAHGMHHYKNSYGVFKKSLSEEINNDIFKKKSAIDNGIAYYITIDCRESDGKFIKRNILLSNLNRILDLSSVSWEQCERFTWNNLIKTTCNMWEKEKMGTKQISECLHISRVCVVKYLKRGAKFGICSYDGAIETIKNMNKNHKSFMKKVACLNTMQVFNGIKYAIYMFNMKSGDGITRSCKNKSKTSGKHPITGEPLKWMYYEDYIEQYGTEGLTYVNEEDSCEILEK